MVFDTDNLRQVVARFLRLVSQQYRIEKAVLYGSYAKGTPRDGSDIDLIVVSPDFVGMPKLERHQKLGWIAWEAHTNYIEPLGFTPEEYEHASPLGLLGEVRDTGVVVYEAQPTFAVHEPPTPYTTGETPP